MVIKWSLTNKNLIFNLFFIYIVINKFNDVEDFSEENKKLFYKQLGKCVARLRKKHKLSQMKLSETMDISQHHYQVVQKYIITSNISV